MAGYAIMRFAKHSGSAGGIEAHHERMKDEYKSNPDVRTQYSDRNVHLVESDDRYSREIKARIEAAKGRNPKLQVRKNSVRFVDTLITSSPSYLQGLPGREIRRYFETALGFFKERVNEKNIISAVIHVDEKTPHMHLVFVPITNDDRLSAKDIIGGPAGCRKWQDDFFKNMSSEFPGLLRGKDAELTGRKNLTPQKYKAVADKGSIREQLNTFRELETLRRYVKAIPEDLREEIRARNLQTRKLQKSMTRERTR
jgi:hypothetical protein